MTSQGTTELPQTTGDAIVMNTNKFKVAADTGNVAVGGSLIVTGTPTLSNKAVLSGDLLASRWDGTTNKNQAFKVEANTGDTTVEGTLSAAAGATLTGITLLGAGGTFA